MIRIFHLLFLIIKHNCFFILSFLPVKGFCIFRYFSTSNKSKQAERLVAFLQSSGPAFIKLGQLLSTRVDILHPEYINQLSKLKDSVKPSRSTQIFRVIEREIGKNLEDIFKDIDHKPIGTGSVAQVHQASLLNGKKVVVKVIKPKVRKQLARDLNLIGKICFFMEKGSKTLRVHKPTKIAKHLEEVTKCEVNLLYEAASLDKIRENFKNNKEVIIPKPYWNYVTDKVLVEEKIDGFSITSTEKIKEYGINPNKVTINLTKLFFLQVMRDGFFHGDIHSGNIMLLPDGRISFIDYGIIGKIDIKNRMYLKNVFEAFLNREYDKVAQIHFDAGWVSSNFNKDDFALACRAIMEKQINLKQGKVQVGKMLEQLLLTASQFQMEIQEDLLLLQKNLLYLESIGRVLSPNENIWVMSRKILKNNISKEITLKSQMDYKLALYSNSYHKMYNKLNRYIDSSIDINNKNIASTKKVNWFGNLLNIAIFITLVVIAYNLI